MYGGHFFPKNIYLERRLSDAVENIYMLQITTPYRDTEDYVANYFTILL